MHNDPAMKRCREAFKSSKMTLRELGEKMGYKRAQDRSAWRLLHMVSDPRISTLRLFAKAMGCRLSDLLGE